MNLLVQKLKYSLFLVLLLASSAVAQEGLRKTDVNAILVMEDGTERPGIMRMATSNKSKPIYKFQEEGSTKFSSLKTDGVSHMFVKTRDGQKYLFVNAPVLIPKGRKKTTVTDGNVMVLVRWKNDDCFVGYAGIYYLDKKDGTMVIKYDVDFGAMLVFKDASNVNGVMLGYMNPRKSDGSMAFMKKHSKMAERAYNAYFGEICPEFIDDFPYEFKGEYDIEELISNYSSSCSH